MIHIPVELPLFLPAFIALLILRAVVASRAGSQGQIGVSRTRPPVWPKLVWEVA